MKPTAAQPTRCRSCAQPFEQTNPRQHLCDDCLDSLETRCHENQPPTHRPTGLPTHGPAAPPRPRYARTTALLVAVSLADYLHPACDRIVIAGSLRRGKETVGDIELLYIPRLVETRSGLFDIEKVSAADLAIDRLLAGGILDKRVNKNGSTMWGPKNKYAMHRASGIPVDMFAATFENWWCQLVCRTGPAESNTRLCMAAQVRGWKWNPYGAGFTREVGQASSLSPAEYIVTSERDVFEFVGQRYDKPEERV